MVSNTRQSERRRALRKAKAGRSRKNKLQQHGSTAPSLTLDRPNAQEKLRQG